MRHQKDLWLRSLFPLEAGLRFRFRTCGVTRKTLRGTQPPAQKQNDAPGVSRARRAASRKAAAPSRGKPRNRHRCWSGFDKLNQRSRSANDKGPGRANAQTGAFFSTGFRQAQPAERAQGGKLNHRMGSNVVAALQRCSLDVDVRHDAVEPTRDPPCDSYRAGA